MMTSITQTLVKKELVMKLVISRENIMYTFLMEGSSMSSTMLMATMVVLSWRSNMMEKHIILSTLGMGMVDMCNTVIHSGRDSWCISTDLTSVVSMLGAKVTTIPGLIIPVSTRPTGTVPIPPIL